MSVTVDQESLPVQNLGLWNVGQVLGHLQRTHRLVVRLLIDGDAANTADMAPVGATPLAGHIIYIETADARQTALEALSQVDQQLAGADALKAQAAENLRANQWPQALANLGQCLGRWQQGQQAVVMVAKLFKIDLDRMAVGPGLPGIGQICARFAVQLRDIHAALSSADLVGLTDLLVYETADTTDQWRAALAKLRMMICAPPAVQLAA